MTEVFIGYILKVRKRLVHNHEIVYDGQGETINDDTLDHFFLTEGFYGRVNSYEEAWNDPFRF